MQVMSARHRIWLPPWVSNEVRQGLISPDGCNCSTFCAYYRNGGVGPKPSVFNLCPVYFLDRKDWFVPSFRGDYLIPLPYGGCLSFIDANLTDEDNRESIFVRFNHEKVFIEFTRGASRPGEYYLEVFHVYHDGRPIEYMITTPVLPGVGTLTTREDLNLERRLEVYLSQFIFPGLPR